MKLEFELPFVSFIFIVMLMLYYFSKKRLRLPENKAFEIILVLSTLSSLTNTILHIISSFNSPETLETLNILS